jgi:hypothetical protein
MIYKNVFENMTPVKTKKPPLFSDGLKNEPAEGLEPTTC